MFLLLWVVVGVGLLLARPAPGLSTGGEAEKTVGSGRSFVGQVELAAQPRPSPRHPSFAAARLWSGEDDWEPAVAADPSSRYVYQLTTRYSGPAACGNCALPAIVFRHSADGGATFEASVVLTMTGSRDTGRSKLPSSTTG